MLRTRMGRASSPAALVIALLALVIAVSSGVGYAAAKIDTAQIHRGAVTSAKIRNHTIKRADISRKLVTSLRGAKGTPGATGPRGPQGDTGATGQQGPPGPAATAGTGGSGKTANSSAPFPATTTRAAVGNWSVVLDCDAFTVSVTNTAKSFRVASGEGMASPLIAANTAQDIAMIEVGGANSYQGASSDGLDVVTVLASCMRDLDTENYQPVVTLTTS